MPAKKEISSTKSKSLSRSNSLKRTSRKDPSKSKPARVVAENSNGESLFLILLVVVLGFAFVILSYY